MCVHVRVCVYDIRYGPNGLGALIVSRIPDFVKQRETFLPQGHKLAHLPEQVLAKCEDANPRWNVGWSRGREKLGMPICCIFVHLSSFVHVRVRYAFAYVRTATQNHIAVSTSV